MKLCDNPACKSHCEVVHSISWGELCWHYDSGFQAPLSIDQLAHFDSESPINFCTPCRKAFEMGVIEMTERMVLAEHYHDQCTIEQLHAFVDSPQEELKRLNKHRSSCLTVKDFTEIVQRAIILLQQ